MSAGWLGVRAVVRRDLRAALRSRAVAIPAVVVPALLLVLLPGLAGLIPRLAEEATAQDLGALLDLLPADVRGGLPADPGLQAAVLTVTHLLSPMVMVVPVLFASVIAADGIAGERERRTLEGLLLTPLTDRDLALAKLLAALVPAVVLGIGGAVLYAVVANVSVGLQVGDVVLPTVEFVLMAAWVSPAFAAVALGATSLISVRVDTVQEAFQLGGILVVPIVGLVVAQASGALLLSAWLLLGAGVVGFGIAAALLRAASRSLSRTRLGERLA